MATRQDVFSVDGVYYNVFIPQDGIERNFAIVDTDDAGRVLTGRMERDIVGTYYNYTVKLDTNFLSTQEYDELYETLSDPVESHELVIPYGQETLVFEAYEIGRASCRERV